MMQAEAVAIDAALQQMNTVCKCGENGNAACPCLKGDELAFVYTRRADLARRIEQCKKELAETQQRQEETPLWGVARLLNDFSK